MSLEDSTSDELSDGHRESSDRQVELARETIGHKTDERKAGKNLDGTEDTTQEQVTSLVVAGEQLEILRGIVREGGGTGGLLSQEEGETSRHALQHRRVQEFW